MKVIWTLARKDLRLLLRDPKAVIILLAMPFIWMLVLGLTLGEGFGQKPDYKLRVSVVDLDRGSQQSSQPPSFPYKPWSRVVLEDMAQTAGIRVELIESREEAQRLVDSGQRAAVIVFGPEFSERVARSSFLAEGINPFFRDGVEVKALGAEVLRDETQLTAASIVEQVAQGSLLRVVLPWMIGQAFGKVGDVEFIDRLSKDEKLKLEVRDPFLGLRISMRDVLKRFSPKQKQELASGLQNALQGMFPKYNLTAKTWASLTRSTPHKGPGAAPTEYKGEEGVGLLKRGAMRYQLLVPSSTVMFAFALVLTVGWLFVSERRQGTLKRLRAAPLSRVQILLGKMVPCYLLSVSQGLLLLAAGKLVFDMSWGEDPWWLLLVVLCTSLAAMGLALLVAALVRTETQVAIFGTLLVLVLAIISGCLMGDRSLLPEGMQEISRLTPHAWALDAYRQLLVDPAPKLTLVAEACGVLTAFGLLFVGLAWWSLSLE